VNLDRIPHTHLWIAGSRHGAFYIVGWSGFWLAAALTLSLTAVRGLSVALQAAIALAAAAVYFSIVALVRRRTGREVLVYYHHILAFLAVAAGLAALAGEPVLDYLDITACGLALFTAVARIGCLMVGCCHGQAASRGIAYGPEHRRYGIPGYLVGQHLIPVQAIESAGCAVLAVAGTAAVLAGAPPGTSFTLFIAGYALLRFGLEWFRGDLGRRYAHGLSEAQWISLALAVAVGAASATGVLPDGPFAVIPAGILLAVALATTAGWFPRRGELLAPAHVTELARRLGRLELSRPDRVITTVTSRGLKVSIGETGAHAHYTLSARTPLSEEGERRVVRLVLWICSDASDPELIHGGAGALHVVTLKAEPSRRRRAGSPPEGVYRIT
jgi:Prolipoprotein diacylglyceryl transferase